MPSTPSGKMGKHEFPKSPRPNLTRHDSSAGRLNQYQSRLVESRRATGGDCDRGKAMHAEGFRKDTARNTVCHEVCVSKRHVSRFRLCMGSIIVTCTLMGLFLLFDSFIFSFSDRTHLDHSSARRSGYAIKEENAANDDRERSVSVVMHPRLLNMASVSLAERELEQKESRFWKETNVQASMWRPCADKTIKWKGALNNSNGYILVSANGGLNQQRVAVCNAVAVASLLNATLIVPRFLYSNVWKDPSQFDDIYEEETFIDTLKEDVGIAKDLPPNLKSLDFKAIGSVVTDADISKEAMPREYITKILPILSHNRIVHFLGFGNRLGFHGVPLDLQRLRCKCNFHALKFVPKIRKTASLLVRRIRKNVGRTSALDKHLLGSSASSDPRDKISRPSKYVALHLRFEIDMVAYSMCSFGGGRNETIELQAYREVHFPWALERLKKITRLSPDELRRMGKCPLTPEEAALMLAGLGFNRATYIYLAGSQIYGGESRMHPLTGLFPNIMTKEDLLSTSELAPFKNFSSQLAALDFIVCTVSDVFAMTDSGSQLSSLVAGLRRYYGGGKRPTLRPIKKTLAAILPENGTLRWHAFERRMRRMIEDGQRVHIKRSIYIQPMCKECMSVPVHVCGGVKRKSAADDIISYFLSIV